MATPVLTIELPGAPGPVGPIGPVGPNGPANTLTIGTVTGGASASATLTGSAPNQTLNLVLPKGDKGDTGNTGPAATITIGSVGTGAPGSNATASLTGSAPNYTLNLTIPRGESGTLPAITSTSITDTTTTGRALMTVADAGAARTLIGAGTSNLLLGTTGTTAAAGDHTHSEITAATSSTGGGTLVKRAADNTFSIGRIYLDEDPVTEREATPRAYIDVVQNSLNSRIDGLTGNGGGGAVFGTNPDVTDLPDGTQVYVIVTDL